MATRVMGMDRISKRLRKILYQYEKDPHLKISTQKSLAEMFDPKDLVSIGGMINGDFKLSSDPIYTPDELSDLQKFARLTLGELANRIYRRLGGK